MAPLNVLISGASVAGPALAYWLVKADCTVTIVERASELRKNGQSVDIRDSGVTVMQRMGIEATVREKTTKEEGLEMVNSKGKALLTSAATGDVKHQNFTSEFEIFRGDLAKIIYDVTHDKVKYVFGEYVKSFTQEGNGVRVEFTNGVLPAQTYDVLVGCDGQNSETRASMFNTTTREHIRSINAYFSYFTIEKDLLDGSGFAKWYNSTGGRLMLMRPDPTRVTRANLGVFTPKGSDILPRFLEAEKQGRSAVKKLMAEVMKDAGWIGDAAIQGMMDSTDFYSSEVAQVRMNTLHKGRVVLCGDAGYGPSPLGGGGTTLALIGGYVLAGEIMNNKDDLETAFKRYEAIILPKARANQYLLPGFPGIIMPQSAWGLSVLRTVLQFVSVIINVAKYLPSLPKLFKRSEFKLPEYSWLA